MNNGSGTTKIELQSTTGNASIGGVTDITGNLNVNTNKFNVVAASGNTLLLVLSMQIAHLMLLDSLI